MLRRIEPSYLAATCDRLFKRIEERFPESSLLDVAKEVRALTVESPYKLKYFYEPIWWLRLLSIFLASIAAIVVAILFTRVRIATSGVFTLPEFVQGVEAGINDIIFIIVGAYFLFTAERRVRRARILKSIQELRALAHIIDLHQLTKDPERVRDQEHNTPSSPERALSPFLLGRYLDYCSELLSILSKLAALYVQDSSDTEVVEAVDEIESLTNGLSRKIWQKIMILSRDPVDSSHYAKV